MEYFSAKGVLAYHSSVARSRPSETSEHKKGLR
jgi:hypothetical protein